MHAITIATLFALTVPATAQEVAGLLNASVDGTERQFMITQDQGTAESRFNRVGEDFIITLVARPEAEDGEGPATGAQRFDLRFTVTGMGAGTAPGALASFRSESPDEPLSSRSGTAEIDLLEFGVEDNGAITLRGTFSADLAATETTAAGAMEGAFDAALQPAEAPQ